MESDNSNAAVNGRLALRLSRVTGGNPEVISSSVRLVPRRSCIEKPSSRKVGQAMLHMLAKNCAALGVHPMGSSPASVQFKGEINGALPRERHQQRHLEFCTAHLLSRSSSRSIIS